MLIILSLLLPLIAGLLLPLLPLKNARQRAIYIECTVICTSVLVWIAMLGRAESTVNLFSIGPGLTLSLHLDGPACIFAGLISILWPLASLYAFEYMEHEERPVSFFAFYTMTYGVTLAVATAANLFTLYVFYECLTLITLPLVIHKKDAKSIRAGRKYLYFSISGAAMAFIALVFTLHYGNGADFTLGGMLDMQKVNGHESILLFVFLLAFIGFGTKAAVFPMFAWLPAASVAPTPVTALLHAVAVVNTGAYAVLRVIYYVFGTAFLSGTTVHVIALLLACFTVLFGSSMAVREKHFKRRLAWSTVSNLSYMLMGAALMTPGGMVGSLSHLVCHGIMKIILFYCAGAILVRTRHEYVQDLRGLSKEMPFTCGTALLSAVAMVGIPPLCGFVSKWNLLTAAAETLSWTGTVGVITILISAVLTAVYLFSAILPMYFSPANRPVSAKPNDPSWRMKLPLLLLALMVVALGFFSEPLITFLRQIASGATF